MATNSVSDAMRESSVVVTTAAPAGGQRGEQSTAEEDDAIELEPEEIRFEAAPPAPAGFQAFLQNVNLHNLLQIENLSRTTGVFQVLSQGRCGYLHLHKGELIHAECGPLTGERAALEILAFRDGEFKSCSRPLASAATVLCSLQALLLRMAKDSDEAAESQRRAPVQARPLEEDKPTEPHLPAVNPSAPAPSLDTAPRSSRLPPPLPPRLERDGGSIAEVVLSPSGEIVSSRGAEPDELSARVAYAARLAELIGRAIRSGTPRALELRGKGTHTTVQWQADGGLAATLGLVQSPKLR